MTFILAEWDCIVERLFLLVPLQRFYSSRWSGKQDWEPLFTILFHHPAPNGSCETRQWCPSLDNLSPSPDSLELSLMSGAEGRDSSSSSASQPWFHVRSPWGSLKLPMPRLGPDHCVSEPLARGPAQQYLSLQMILMCSDIENHGLKVRLLPRWIIWARCWLKDIS